MWAWVLSLGTGCGPQPPAEALAPVGSRELTPISDRSPVYNSRPDFPITRVSHRRHEGRELFVDGVPQGPLPVTVPVQIGSRTFGILVGPGEWLTFERPVIPKPGILVIELGS